MVVLLKLLLKYLEYCGWGNERRRKKVAAQDGLDTLSLSEKGFSEKAPYPAGDAPNPRLDCIAAIVGYREDPVIFTRALASYNDAETISTLRFGVRAKSIKNNAKINQEMSPAELKAYLRKAQSEVSTFKDYISQLEEEVGTWRRGESVPKEKWTPSLKASGGRPAAPRPASTPNILQEQQRQGEG